MLKGRSHILIGSFLVALAFWFSVTMSGSFRASFDIPLTVTRLPDDLALTSPLPETVNVLLQADGWQLLFINAGKQLTFDIPGARLRAGVIQTNRALNEMMQLPPGVTALRVYPETLFVHVDRYMEKRVPLRLTELRMDFKEGFGLVREPEVTPDSVTLRGAESVLREIESWPIEGRTYENLSLPVAEEVALRDSLPGIVHTDRDKVSLYIPIEQLADMWIRDIRVELANVPEDRQVLLERQSLDISVRGGVNVLSLYSAADFSAEIDFQTIVSDTSGTIVPVVHIPADIKLLRIDPPSIRYTIRR
jgi:hypothetical protein